MVLSKTRGALGVCSVLSVIGIMYAQFGMEIRLSQKGAKIVGNAEGCFRVPYKCPADVLSIGIGSTEAGGEPIDPKRIYSDFEIAERWKNDIKIAESCVNRFANGRALPQSVFDAAVSITFNVGCGRGQKSTLFRKLNTGDYIGACNEYPKWVYAGKTKLPGLVIRREKEKALCLLDLSKQ